MLTKRRSGTRADGAVAVSGNRPVLLATMEVPFDDEAATFAVDAAVENGQKLIVANVVEIPLGPMCVMMGYGDLDPPAAEIERMNAPAALAHAFGVDVERLRIRSPHPIDALLDLVAERKPGVLVFGPDRAQLRPRTFRKVARKIRERATCLIWISD